MVLSMSEFNMLGRPSGGSSLQPYTQSYSSGRSLPYLTPKPGESARALHARRVAAAESGGSNVSADARSALQRAMDQYRPGGGFSKGVEAALERGRIKSEASGMQNLVSSGLAGTTMAAGLGKKYEEEVASPARARMESIRAEKISGLEAILAEMEQGGFQAELNRNTNRMPVSSGFSAPRVSGTPQPYPISYAPSGDRASGGILTPLAPNLLGDLGGERTGATFPMKGFWDRYAGRYA